MADTDKDAELHYSHVELVEVDGKPRWRVWYTSIKNLLQHPEDLGE